MAQTSEETREELAAALRELRRKDEQITGLLREKYEPIAVVGMGLRCPGGNDDVDAFAEFLRQGRSGIGPLPADERREMAHGAGTGDGLLDEHPRGGFVEGVDRFDAAFFSVSPKEAPYIAPQQRLTLETAWEALEHAGIDPVSLRHGDTGVFMGVTSLDYIFEATDLAPEDLTPYLAPGLTHSGVSGRLSYVLGLRGPCMSIDTTCSSSLVAAHLAVQALREGECGIALCGGVNVMHNARSQAVLALGGMLAPDGQCKTFDETADGYARAEGCGVLVLKRLGDARRDGDTVHAVIRGSAVRQDGESAGLTAPNGAAQEEVMRAALTRSRLEPGDIQYVEAHGTGTALGDPTETDAITGVFGASHSGADPVLVGSLKTNIGHMEGAAGVGGLIKTVLQLRERTVYPHLNLVTPSPVIAWQDAPFAVPTEVRPWPGDGVGRALVNSFGVTGTIATVVLEGPPTETEQAPTTGNATGATTTADAIGTDTVTEAHPVTEAPAGAVITLSAKSRTSLRRLVERHLEHLERHPDVSVTDLCRTSNTGRAHFRHRIADVVRDREDLARTLGKRLADLGRVEPAGRPGNPKVAYLFSGTGTQYPGMGSALYHQYAVFRDAIDACDRVFAPLTGLPPGVLVRGEDDVPGRIHEARHLQPALFSLEYAMARLWLSWGVRPSVLVGHSLGEYAAAATAGLFSLEDAARLVAARGRLSGRLQSKGGMAAVGVRAADIAPLLERYPDLAVGAVNGPAQCLLTGGTESLADAGARLTEQGVKVTPLRGAAPYHCDLMSEIADEFRAELATVEFRVPTMAVVSNVTGRVARSGEMGTPDYWIRHLLEPVQFEACVQAVERRGRHVFVEMGPSTALASLARTTATDPEHVWLSSTFRDDTTGDMIRRSLAGAYEAGVPVSWTGYHRDAPRTRVQLPAYPFDRKPYWLPTPQRREAEAAWAAERGPRPEPDAALPLLHEQHWVARPAGEPGEKRGVLLLRAPEELRSRLLDRAPEAGVEPICPAGPEELVAALRDGPPRDVVWFWHRAPEDTTGVERLRAECALNYGELLPLLDILAREGFGDGRRLWLVTEGAHTLPGDPGADAPPAVSAAATLWGFARSLAVERPGYRVTLVDLQPGTEGTGPLIDEWSSPQDTEFEVAHRDGQRWVRRLRPAGPAPEPGRPVEIRPDRTYVVAGGLGTVGLHMARRLVALGARDLLLLSRTGGEAPELGDGVTVTVRRCDIGSAPDVDRVFAELADTGRPVGGVVHAAADGAHLPVAEQTWQNLDTVFRAKVYGAWLLHEATARLPRPDFFLLCSTAGATIGSALAAGPGAGDAFLAHLAARRARADLPALAVDWGPWVPRDPDSAPVRSWEAQGIRPLDETEAAGLLPGLLDAGRTHVVVGRCDWGRFVSRRPGNALFDELVTDRATTGGPVDPGTLPETPGPARSAGINTIVRSRLADVLRFRDADDLEPDAELAALGMDSLNAVEIRTALEAAFLVTLPTSVVYEQPRVDLLSAYIERLLPAKDAPVS
ncbi:beta-ketoacyl synthase N-terminal-like domain-containing protein [Streptomyces sp. NPDC091212]|uniref:type I polyketide synthase n=1 Tax=Streptomyces sp. NPDC091212 TaxID=3155191 RepID=UPI003437C7A1